MVHLAAETHVDRSIDDPTSWYLDHTEWVETVVRSRYAGKRLGTANA